MEQVESTAEVGLAIPAEQVGLDIEGHWVSLVEEADLMVEMDQVSPEN